ncbi:FkbM family methyltransferase [Variovorax sp. PAMC28562]|uniref:FkbM family methyltransferase n=1 Tax=Variovorax sp. PAMC28562 TaxID=2762323 RepID=UPI00164EA2D1|nr:FkbM family methyltransferase [Variovorax sp. PAMC28562]QNK75212.1 FkbM family methyltransferase [Variovorax sp. PAMC28562]
MSQFVSYAQNYEDVMLRRALLDVEHGFYIDVGAQREESDSVTKAFSLAGWRGINIEPHPGYFEELVRGRPLDINLDVAIGEREGSLTISFIDDTGLSTADDEIAKQHAAAGYAIRTQEVAMLTLAIVWQRHVSAGQPVHFLKVDVEGLEQAVLAGNDWTSNRPWIVLVEATLPNSQVENHASWEPMLLDAGYVFVYADGLNRFYVAPEHAERCAAFKYPPNVFDGFITLPLQRSIEDVKTLRQTIGEIEAVRVQAAQREQALGKRLALRADNLKAASSLAVMHEKAASSLAVMHEKAASSLAVMHEENVALDRALRESHRRIEVAEEALVQAHERESELRERVEAAGKSWFELSPWFRDFAPARFLRRQGRRVAKAGWWALTPWRIPERLRFIRTRGLPATHETPPASQPRRCGAGEVHPCGRTVAPRRAAGSSEKSDLEGS